MIRWFILLLQDLNRLRKGPVPDLRSARAPSRSLL